MYGTIFRLIWPYLQRLLAKQTAEYLQKRREQRLQARGGKESTATLLAEQAHAIVAPLAQKLDQEVKRLEYSPAQSRFAIVDAVWFTLSGVLLGSAISLILARVFLREE
jgi:hypothetical protein